MFDQNKNTIENIGLLFLVNVLFVSLLALVLYLQKDRVFEFFAGEYEQEIAQQITKHQTVLLTHEDLIIKAVENANPSVVSVIATKDVAVSSGFDSFFPEGFFPFDLQFPEPEEDEMIEQEVGGGSGFVVADNMIVTNRHVVEDDEADFSILTNDGESFEAEILAVDPMLDIAILGASDLELPSLEFDDSDQIKVGQTAIAIGNALGEFRNTVSTGVVSGLSRSIEARGRHGQIEALEEVIQTDAAINPGNSGGPLLNSSGEVVGVNVAMASGSQNIGFALPSNFVANIVDSVKEHGEIIRPFIGIRYVGVDQLSQDELDVSIDHGLLITSGDSQESAIFPGSPADVIGLQENDVILSIDGQKLERARDLVTFLRRKSVGEQVTLEVLRESQIGEFELVLERIPEELST